MARGGRSCEEVGFNSATAVMPWRFTGRMNCANSLRMLQFGHGCDAVEIDKIVKAVEAAGGASIRPRL